MLRYACSHDAAARGGGAEGRRERGDGQPGAQRQARRLRGDPGGGAHRARRARLRAAHQAARRAGPAGRAGAARAAEPDLPGVRPRSSAARWRSRGSPRVLCTQTAGGVSEADYVDLLLEQQQVVRDRSSPAGSTAEADADARPLRAARRRKLPGRADQRRGRRAAVPAGRLRRRGRDRAGDRAPARRSGTSGSAWSSGPRDHVPSDRKLASPASAAPGPAAPSAGLVEHSACSRCESGQAAAAALLDRGVTGVVCASDPLALGAIRAVRRRRAARARRRLGDRLRRLGLHVLLDPPLTTVRQPIEAMGGPRSTCWCTRSRAAGVRTDELLFEPELVVRPSTGLQGRSRWLRSES